MQKVELDVQGHRGCRGLRPENTIPAMLYALELGVTTLEMDVVITGDEKVIVSHEPYFNHLISSHPDGSIVEEKEAEALNIFRMNYDEVKKYDVGRRKNPSFPEQVSIAASKPLLTDLIEVAERKGKPFYNIETKCTPQTDSLYHPSPQKFVDLLLQVVRDKGIEERVIIQSFDLRTLRYLHSIAPHIQTALLIESYKGGSFEDHLKELGFIPTIYSSHFSIVNSQLVRACHNLKIRVIPWTVNDEETAKQLIEFGVDGIISDYPDRILKLVKSK